MPTPATQMGFATVGEAKLYYEIAGEGTPLVMLHAGVADSRQWDNEFRRFAEDHRVLRYDRRGYGRSEPVEGEYSHLGDLVRLLDELGLREPLVVMGCSMGGGLAMDFALDHPTRVKALIMVGAGPGGLELDVPPHPKEAAAEEAFEAGDLDKVAELETQIWFDGIGRTPGQVDQRMRELAYEMDRLALSHEAKELGTLLPDTEAPAVGRLPELHVYVLVVVGAEDIPFLHAAAEYMTERLPRVRAATIEDAAHLCNMDQPEEFYRVVKGFLDDVPD